MLSHSLLWMQRMKICSRVVRTNIGTFWGNNLDIDSCSIHSTMLQLQVQCYPIPFLAPPQLLMETRLPSNVRQNHTWMHTFSNVWSLPVMWQDGTRPIIWSSTTKNPMLHANFTVICSTELELLPIEVLHCGNMNFWPVWHLWFWPWPNDLHMRTWPVFPGDVTDEQKWSPTSKLSKVIVWQTDTQNTDRETYRQTWHT